MRDGDEVEVILTGCEFKRVGEKETPMCELMAKVGEADEDAGQELKVAIFMTEKSAGIARQQFKKFGFEIDKHDLSRLPEFIKSKSPRVMVTIESREYNGNLYYQGAIEVGDRPKNVLPKDELAVMTGWLRNAKKNRDEEKPHEFSEADKAKARSAGVGKKASDSFDPDSIPF